MTDLAPGRYCLAVCYCGECPHYKPLPRSQPIASTKTTPSTPSTWDAREDATWIDEL